MRSRIFALATVLVAAFASAAIAQAPQGTPVRVRGTVEKLDGHTLMVKSRDGQDVSVTLAPNYRVSAVVKRSLADIHVGDFLASTSVKGTDGKLHALEVTIYPEAARAKARELQIPWDLVPDSVMTNAVVTGMVSAEDGSDVKMTVNGKETEVVVPTNIPIVTFAPGDASLLKPGAAVFVFARKQPDNSLSAALVIAEKDGVKPPM